MNSAVWNGHLRPLLKSERFTIGEGRRPLSVSAARAQVLLLSDNAELRHVSAGPLIPA
jgi:hypothetical protein